MFDHAEKLAEAAFFLELFEALELRGEPMTHAHSHVAEASYLFSGVLNAFYAALYQRREKTGNHKVYQAFKKLHPEIHASTEQDGWRNLTVHRSHVPISGTNFVPTFGLDAASRISASKLAQNEEVLFAPVEVHLIQYCVNYRGQPRPVLEFCREHLLVLQQFIETN